MIDTQAAERLRTLLSDVQAALYNENAIPEPVREKLVVMISEEGFGLVDELEGVIGHELANRMASGGEFQLVIHLASAKRVRPFIGCREHP